MQRKEEIVVMILNDVEIRNRVISPEKYGMDYPLITPFFEGQLQGASYDVTIENEIICFSPIADVVDIKKQNSIDSIYKKDYISPNGFVLMPNTYTLITLHETFFIPKDLTAHLRPKTRYIRMGLLISGQHINPDSICKLNIGLFNMTPNPIRLYEGISIGQMVFEEMFGCPSDEKLYRIKKDANYAEDIEFVGAKFGNEFADFINKQVDQLLD